MQDALNVTATSKFSDITHRYVTHRLSFVRPSLQAIRIRSRMLYACAQSVFCNRDISRKKLTNHINKNFTYQKSCIVENTVSDRFKFFFLCSLFFVSFIAWSSLRLTTSDNRWLDCRRSLMVVTSETHLLRWTWDIGDKFILRDCDYA